MIWKVTVRATVRNGWGYSQGHDYGCSTKWLGFGLWKVDLGELGLGIIHFLQNAPVDKIPTHYKRSIAMWELYIALYAKIIVMRHPKKFQAPILLSPSSE